MINTHILFLGLIFSIIEIIVGYKMVTKNNKKGSLLIIHAGSLIFATVFLTFINNLDLSENLSFIVFISLFYIVTLILLCNERIKEKKNMLYQQEQERINNWK